jgi:hypothetical protein
MYVTSDLICCAWYTRHDEALAYGGLTARCYYVAGLRSINICGLCDVGCGLLLTGLRGFVGLSLCPSLKTKIGLLEDLVCWCWCCCCWWWSKCLQSAIVQFGYLN